MIDPDDDHEWAAAVERFRGHETYGTERFSQAVSGDGFRGDVAIDADELPAGIAEGDSVAAKRLGWDDEESDDDPDRTPYSEMEYDSPDLVGELTAIHFTLPTGEPGVGWEVGGQPADPKTIQKAG